LGEILSLGVVRRMEMGSTRGEMPADLDSTKLITRAARLLQTVCLCTTRGGAEDGDGQHAGEMPADLDSKS